MNTNPPIINNPDVTGMICGISHGTTKDGPGWRSIIYFKGCNFRCPWCGSPETWSFEPELMLYPELERYPETAVSACKKGAVSLVGEKTNTDRSICSTCNDMHCTKNNPDGSREKAGYRISVEQAVAEVSEYVHFHRDYGVTLSGGEVTCQWVFFLELLKGMKAAGIHTAAETNGSFDLLPHALEWLDLLIIDLKHPDPDRHKSLTGFSNDIVIKNIFAIVEQGHPVRVRIPVVPGINDGQFIEMTENVLAGVRTGIELEIIGYNRMGIAKWEALGRSYTFERVVPPDEESLEEIRMFFNSKKYTVVKS